MDNMSLKADSKPSFYLWEGCRKSTRTFYGRRQRESILGFRVTFYSVYLVTWTKYFLVGYFQGDGHSNRSCHLLHGRWSTCPQRLNKGQATMSVNKRDPSSMFLPDPMSVLEYNEGKILKKYYIENRIKVGFKVRFRIRKANYKESHTYPSEVNTTHLYYQTYNANTRLVVGVWRARPTGGRAGRGARAAGVAGALTTARNYVACLLSNWHHACRRRQYFYLKSDPTYFSEYLQSLCTGLYESLRSQIIHINHLETLAELCVILRVEVIEEQVNNDRLQSSVGCQPAWGASALGGRPQLQGGRMQERLVYRAHVHLRADVLLYRPAHGDLAYPSKLLMMEVSQCHVHLRADVLLYRPAHGDLAYPSKLLMMEQIAMSIQEQSLKRSDSRNSMISDISATSQEVANINVEAQKRPQASPADLHGMWYPGVRRTLAALSRLYRCLEKKVFQGLAQEAISLCVQSVDNAAKQISTNATNIDGELFQIKHLLILREQIAPFQVDFVVKETTLDFSNVKNAAYGLIQKPRQIFSLNSNNALLEFLLEGTPMVREHLLDSRKEVDRQLKSCCELFIKDATEILAGPMIAFIEKATAFAPIEQLKSQPWATPEEIAVAVKEAQKKIKAHLAPLQRSMQLYLANKETEFILFRPIRNNVVGYFVQIEQLLTNAGYTYEDTLIVACPTPEQVSVFISSASLISHSEPVQPFGTKVKPSVVRKPSVTSVQEKEEITVGVEATPTS
ncbi:hypothetical protein SFRURICE_019444, partial [Spodoptera frugiperda]